MSGLPGAGLRRAVTVRTRALLLRSPLRGSRGYALLLLLLVLVIAIIAVSYSTPVLPTSALALPMVLGLLLLRLSDLRVVVAAGLLAAVLDVASLGFTTARIATLVLLALIGAIAYYSVVGRERLGITGTRGDSMLGELRDRLMGESRLPALPSGWNMDVSSRASGGTAFGGDFLVSRIHEQQWELALVDVSGNGIEAGTRALQLNGALGALLGSVPRDEFLRHANRYLLRQGWVEGFATAVHLAVDLRDGSYVVRSAGHPPVAAFSAGNGTWTLAEAAGPALGLLEYDTYEAVGNILQPGDAVMLYTDGVVERPGRDLTEGIDKLLGEANRLVVAGFHGGCARLMRAVAPTSPDDRSLVLVWRD